MHYAVAISARHASFPPPDSGREPVKSICFHVRNRRIREPGGRACGRQRPAAMTATPAPPRPRRPDVRGAGPCGLAHARLSIIDLAGGAPADGERRRPGLAHVQRRDLQLRRAARGADRAGPHASAPAPTPRSSCRPTRVRGDDCVTRFNGQFAFAIWDAQRATLCSSSRDRLGVRPLFYAAARAATSCSAPRSSRCWPTRACRASSICSGLTRSSPSGAPTPPRTVFEAYPELPPGHSMRVDGRPGRASWRTGSSTTAPDERGRAAPTMREELRALLIDATAPPLLRPTCRSAPICSGGLDSTVIAGLVTRYTDGRCETFSVTFDDPEFDESGFQQQAVDALGVRQHRSVRCSGDDIGRVFPDVVWHAEQPIVRTAPRRCSCCRGWCASRATRSCSPARAPTRCSAATTSSRKPRSAASGPADRARAWRPLLLKRALSVHAEPADASRRRTCRPSSTSAGGPRRARSSRTCRAGS